MENQNENVVEGQEQGAEQESMELTNQIRQEMVTRAQNKLEDVVADETVKAVVVDYLVHEGLTSAELVKDMDGFTTRILGENDQPPVLSLLVGNRLITVWETTVQNRLFQQDYLNHLEQEEMYDDELSYDEFVRDHMSEEGQETVGYEEIKKYSFDNQHFGEIFIGLRKEKTSLSTRLQSVDEKLESIRGVVESNFLNGFQV